MAFVVKRLRADFCSLGQRGGVQVAAESQAVGSSAGLWSRVGLKGGDDAELVSLDESMSKLLVGTTYSLEQKDEAAGRALDRIVDVAGSRPFFGGIVAITTAWAVAGAATGGPDLWQIIFQDVSSIQCYISDMILMRQQINDFREHLRIIALLRSRSYTITKCFRLLIEQGRLNNALSQTDTLLSSRTLSPTQLTDSPKLKPFAVDDLEAAAEEMIAVGDAISLIPQDSIDRAIVFMADVMGSVWMLIAFVIGMVTWVGLGPLYDFSVNWQLWLNTCTALQQTLSTSLLTLARNRRTYFVEQCMCAIFRQECEVEYRARTLVSCSTPNEVVEIEWSPEGRFERWLDWYAAFIGSGYGATLGALLFALWLAVGHLLSWGDNWWLIIGTWTGVVGTFNAAVLRYSLQHQAEKSSKEFDVIFEQDSVLFKELGLQCTNQMSDLKPNLMTRVSMFTSWVCATPWAVLATLALIIGMLVGATIMLWTETAQLFVNSVTMIVESFFLIVLIEAHNIQATQHRLNMHNLLKRRLQLLVVLKRVAMEEASSSSKPSSNSLDKSVLCDEAD